MSAGSMPTPRTERFALDTDTTTPPWMQLRLWLIDQIKRGIYQPGDRMPTIRALAAEVSMNNNTASKAYTSMINDGYLQSRQGSGVFASDLASPNKDERGKIVDFALESCIATCRDLGLSLHDIEKTIQKRIRGIELREEQLIHEEDERSR
ncbi:MAG: GntR family transcriptional regulator [Gordonibacter sp.]|uniref:GntR family transcriptional regulator n=1 Tax=Gordonibacter sp. TaxID=1968902 RepID=UPI002FC5FAB3